MAIGLRAGSSQVSKVSKHIYSSPDASELNADPFAFLEIVSHNLH